MKDIPSNDIAEKALLGLLLSNETSISELESQGITADHFHCHRIPFDEIATFTKNGGGDVSLLVMQAHENGTLDDIGGAHFFTSTALEGSASALLSYVQALRQTRGKRLVMQAGGKLAINPEDPEAIAQIIAGQAEIDLASNGSLASMIIERTFDISNPPSNPPPMISLGKHGLFTAGNLSALIADRKAGKSSALSAIIAAIIAPRYSQGDFLGFTAENPAGKAVVHFDTEQSPADHHALIVRALHRAGLQKPPAWFSSYSLTGLSLAERTRFVANVCDREALKHGGLQLVIVDGIADLCRDPNDQAESFDLVEHWHNFSVNHACVTLAVLHLNPGTEKSRGHLGSQLERKAETPLMIKKNAKGISTMYATHARKAHFPDSEGFSFQWSDDAQMHLSITTEERNQARDEIRRNKAADEANKIMAGLDAMSYTDLCQSIEKGAEVKERAAKNRVKEWQEMGIITKLASGLYTLKN
ncbi:MAG: hypothetical protein CAK88_08915 [Verrucomicrobiia bacterium AMD-G2]|nr:MAG: hypothetical protein CAK88_08915 [Verrucomicrobiae bacterium AMD-G2]